LQVYVWCFEYSIIIYNNHDSLKGVKAPAIDGGVSTVTTPLIASSHRSTLLDPLPFPPH
jgi:hypothetical protein